MNRTKKAAQMLTGIPVEIRRNLPQQEKISNALAVMLDDEIDEAAPLDEYRTALAVVVLAWNISLLPASVRADSVQTLLAAMDGGDAFRREFQGRIERLAAKKQDLFPHDRRFVVSHEVEYRKGCLHITAAAFTPAQETA
jgi:hypothetical protein